MDKLERVPPYSQDAERGVLGAILLDSKRVVDLCLAKKMTTDDFHIPQHSRIFAAFGTMYAKDVDIDVLTTSQFLRQKKQLEGIGGAVFLDRLIDSTPTAAHAEHYIEEVKKHSMRRKLISAAREVEREAYDIENPEDLRSRAEVSFTSLERNDKSVPICDIFDDIDRDIELGMAGTPPEIGIPTGFRGVDEAFEGGLRNGGVYWLSGEEGTGKTSLKCNIIDRILKNTEHKVADLSLEMTRRAEIEKLIGISTGQNISRIIRGKTKFPRIDEIKEAREMYEKSGRFFIEDQKSVHLTTELFSWGRRMVHKFGCKLLCIDYFQRLRVPGGEKMTMEKETAMKSNAVVDLAGHLNVPILCVAAINADGKIRGSRQSDYDGEGHLRLSEDDPDYEPQGPDFIHYLTGFSQKARFGRKSVKIPLEFIAATGVFKEPGQDRMVEEEEQLWNGE